MTPFRASMYQIQHWGLPQIFPKPQRSQSHFSELETEGQRGRNSPSKQPGLKFRPSAMLSPSADCFLPSLSNAGLHAQTLRAQGRAEAGGKSEQEIPGPVASASSPGLLFASLPPTWALYRQTWSRTPSASPGQRPGRVNQSGAPNHSQRETFSKT